MECNGANEPFCVLEIDHVIAARSDRDCLNELTITGFQVIFSFNPLWAEDRAGGAPHLYLYAIVPGFTDSPLNAQSFIHRLGNRGGYGNLTRTVVDFYEFDNH